MEYLVESLPSLLTMLREQGGYLDGNGEITSSSCNLSLRSLIFGRLFLVEAIATIIMGVGVWFLLPDCKLIWLDDAATFSTDKASIVPETASWLTDKEKAFIQARLPSNSPRATEQDFKLSVCKVSSFPFCSLLRGPLIGIRDT